MSPGRMVINMQSLHIDELRINKTALIYPGIATMILAMYLKSWLIVAPGIAMAVYPALASILQTRYIRRIFKGRLHGYYLRYPLPSLHGVWRWAHDVIHNIFANFRRLNEGFSSSTTHTINCAIIPLLHTAHSQWNWSRISKEED